LQFVTTILSIKLNRKRLCVILQSQIHIYDITSMKLIHSIETCSNPSGVCAMSSSSDMSLIAYPTQQDVGELMVFDAVSLQAVNIVQAHKSAVALASFNFDGTLLATASEKVLEALIRER
jgi:autophagy-related protein 18